MAWWIGGRHYATLGSANSFKDCSEQPMIVLLSSFFKNSLKFYFSCLFEKKTWTFKSNICKCSTMKKNICKCLPTLFAFQNDIKFACGIRGDIHQALIGYNILIFYLSGATKGNYCRKFMNFFMWSPLNSRNDYNEHVRDSVHPQPSTHPQMYIPPRWHIFVGGGGVLLYDSHHSQEVWNLPRKFHLYLISKKYANSLTNKVTLFCIYNIQNSVRYRYLWFSRDICCSV